MGELVDQLNEKYADLCLTYDEEATIRQNVAELESMQTEWAAQLDPVSYTHLDVYKRQLYLLSEHLPRNGAERGTMARRSAGSRRLAGPPDAGPPAARRAGG